MGALRSLEEELNSSERNDQCHKCDEGGDLLECYGCNVVYHRECLSEAHARSTAEELDDSDAEWACEDCLRDAMETFNSLNKTRKLHRLRERHGEPSDSSSSSDCSSEEEEEDESCSSSESEEEEEEEESCSSSESEEE